MSFIWPIMLVLLVLIPLFVVMYLRQQRRRQRLLTSYGALGLMHSTSGRGMGRRRHLPPLLFLLALTCLIIAVARPQTVLSLPHVEGTVILAFDVSGSMAADDLKPTRMEAAKAAARAFVEKQPRSILIGVVAFSESGFSVQPPTNDQAAILAAIDRLAPTRGTSLASGILMAINALTVKTAPVADETYSNLQLTPTPTPTPLPRGTYTPGVIIMLTDGENTAPPDPMTAAQTAIDRGVRIYPIGIGSVAGTILKVNGYTVRTHLDEETLQQIADATDGVYYHADNEDQLKTVYDNVGSQLVVKPEKTEITALLAGLSVVLLLIGGALSLLWFSRLP
jgi:Ca-activated chloride channel family protein